MYKIHKNGPFPFFFLLLKIFEFEICHFIHSSPVNVQDFKFHKKFKAKSRTCSSICKFILKGKSLFVHLI